MRPMYRDFRRGDRLDHQTVNFVVEQSEKLDSVSPFGLTDPQMALVVDDPVAIEYVQISKTTKIAGRYLGNWYSRDAYARTWTEQEECWIDPPNDETLTAATKYMAKYIGSINSPYGTLTITGNPLGGSFTITVDGQTTAAIPWNAKAARVSLIPNAAGLTGGTSPDVTWTDATSTLTVTGSPTGGDFTVAVDGEATAAIAYNASAGDVQTALEALSNLVPGDVTVTGSAGGPWVLTFVLSVEEALEALSTVGTGNVTVTGTGTVGLPPYGVTFATAPGEVSVDDSGLTGGTAPEVTWTWGPSSVFMTDAICCGQGTDLSGPGIMTESGIVIETESGQVLITESGE